MTVNERRASTPRLAPARSVPAGGQHRSPGDRQTIDAVHRLRLEAALRELADGVVVVDSHGRNVLTNRAYDEHLAVLRTRTLEDESGTPILNDQRPRKRASRGEHFDISFSTTDRSGHRRWYHASGRPLGEEAGGGGVLVIRDVTDRNLRELQTTFVAMLSHELRTPLTALSGYLELLVRELDAPQADERARRYAERSLAQVRRFVGLVEELFDANRLRSGRMQFRFRQTALRPIVAEAIDLVQPLAGDRPILLDSGTGRLQIHADAARIQQVVINLLTNAVRHAPDSPKIEIRLRRRRHAAEIVVRDYGPGMVPEELARLRQPLRELAAAPEIGSVGLGLGLYIARSIVAAHSGTFRVESQLGAGTTFVVMLPTVARRRDRAPLPSGLRAATDDAADDGRVTPREAAVD
jgi:two-component system CheB/CheR fusion protein